jgi:hypothetical protein
MMVQNINMILKLQKIESLNEKGEPIFFPDRDKDGNEKLEKGWDQNDIVSLIELLRTFDSTNHTFNEYKLFINIYNKVMEVWKFNKNEIDLSLDQSKIIKDILISFLDENNKKKTKLNPFLGKTVISLLEQLEDGK